MRWLRDAPRAASAWTVARYSRSCSGRTVTRETVRIRPMLRRVLGEVLQAALQIRQEPVRIGTVHDPMIVGHRQHALGANAEGVGAVRESHHRRALLDGANAEDRDLGLIDDRRTS